MAGPRNAPQSPRAKGKTPAERSVEFDAEQARLKAEAAERRKAREKAAAAADKPPAK
jgi:hypothetical protein